MMVRAYTTLMDDVLISIQANIADLKERRSFADPEELNYIEGKLMAYNEVLTIIRSSAKEFEQPQSDQQS
jgi:hypothetical protein